MFSGSTEAESRISSKVSKTTRFYKNALCAETEGAPNFEGPTAKTKPKLSRQDQDSAAISCVPNTAEFGLTSVMS